MPLYEVFDTSARRRKEIREIKTVRDFLQICIDQCEEKITETGPHSTTWG
jgi:hypothetical protein